MRNLVVYGLGELGQLYGAAALRAGYRVTPITRHSDPHAVLATLAPDVPIVVAVAESALEEALTVLGKARGDSAILLQNELFPSLWRRHDVTPTVLVPWLLKKRGTPLLVARPTPVFGAHAELVATLHRALELPFEVLPHEHALYQALVAKYAFILTINALGLLRDRTLGMWLQEDPERVSALARRRRSWARCYARPRSTSHYASVPWSRACAPCTRSRRAAAAPSRACCVRSSRVGGLAWPCPSSRAPCLRPCPSESFGLRNPGASAATQKCRGTSRRFRGTGAPGAIWGPKRGAAAPQGAARADPFHE